MDASGLLPTLLMLALLLVSGVLAVLLKGQIAQRQALRDWLQTPQIERIPDGSGAWSDVFSLLQRLRKDEEKKHIALTRTLERFRLAAQALPDGIILLDEQEHIEWLNAAACQHFSLDATRDVGTRVGQLIRHSEFFTLLAAGGDAAGTDPLLLRMNSNKTEQVLSVLLIPFARSGNLLLSRDVTALVRTEAVRRDFVANVSHELRTPLTVIGGFIEQFQSATPPTGENAQLFFKLMAEQSERMNRLVADLLTLSRLENDTRPAPDDLVAMTDMLSALQLEATALSAGRHEIEMGEITAGNLRGCAVELRSAFGNLVSNAVRHTPAGGHITLSWRVVSGCPTFSVTDSGIGIPAEHLPRLTERFYRVDKGRSVNTGGTGLGLAIVKHVLARHGGNLKIESEIGRGSTFSAVLPAQDGTAGD